MTPDTNLQKELATAKVAQVLGSDHRARSWMKTYREDFEGRNAEEMIDQGHYDMVLDYIVRIEPGVY